MLLMVTKQVIPAMPGDHNNLSFAILDFERRSDSVVDLLQLLRGSVAKILDKAPAKWTIDFQGECPAELADPHGQQRARVGVHLVHRIDRRQVIVGVNGVGGDNEPSGGLAGPAHHGFVTEKISSSHAV
jgi:hypothetical protein